MASLLCNVETRPFPHPSFPLHSICVESKDAERTCLCLYNLIMQDFNRVKSGLKN